MVLFAPENGSMTTIRHNGGELILYEAGSERARRDGAKGGRKAAETKRRRRDMRAVTRSLLDAPLTGDTAENMRRLAPDLPESDITLAAQVIAGQMQAAAEGNAQAFRNVMELDGSVDTEEKKSVFVRDFGLLIAPTFLEPHRAIAAGTVTDIWLEGGRGSTKSSFCSLELVYALEHDPDANALVMQYNGVDIRNGSFAQVLWAMEQLGVSEHWRARRSARSIINTDTGQLVLFRGGDDPRKTKGVKFDHGYCAVLWIEEADQFKCYADLRTIYQSVTRGGKILRLHSLNPPRSIDAWANVECDRMAAEHKPGVMVHRSTYLDVPREWLGDQFFEDAEGLKEIDERAYRHEYLGEATGTGGKVFPDAVFQEITDDVIARFDRLCAGQDWGWWPDPWAFVLSAWEPSTRTLWSFAERGGNRLQPTESAEMIRDVLTWQEDSPTGKQNVYHAIPVLSDDSEPSKIAAHRDSGINATAAGKGGKRMQSYEWLASIHWVIDPVRCPNLAREVRAMEYSKAQDGKWLNDIPDGNDHWVDAVRYSVMPIVKRRGAYRANTQR